MVSGVPNMTRGLGTALGVALAAALYVAAAGLSGTNASPTASAAGLTVSLAALGALAVAAAALALLRQPETAGVGEQQGDQSPLPSPRAASYRAGTRLSRC